VQDFFPLGQMTETTYPASRNARASLQTRLSTGTGRFSTMMQTDVGSMLLIVGSSNSRFEEVTLPTGHEFMHSPRLESRVSLTLVDTKSWCWAPSKGNQTILFGRSQRFECLGCLTTVGPQRKSPGHWKGRDQSRLDSLAQAPRVQKQNLLLI